MAGNPKKSVAPNALTMFDGLPNLAPQNKAEALAVISNNEIRIGALLWTSIGLQVDGEVKQEDWEETGRVLKRLDISLQWLIGDWANIYVGDEPDEQKRGEIYLELQERFDMNSRTIRNYASVCRNLALSLRRDSVGFSVHREIAELPESLKGNEEYFLDWAEEKQATVAKIREHIALKLKELTGIDEVASDEVFLFSKKKMPKNPMSLQSVWAKARNGNKNAKNKILVQLAQMRKWADEVEESLED